MSFDLNEFLYGQSITAYEYFGAHKVIKDNVDLTFKLFS